MNHWNYNGIPGEQKEIFKILRKSEKKILRKILQNWKNLRLANVVGARKKPNYYHLFHISMIIAKMSIYLFIYVYYYKSVFGVRKSLGNAFCLWFCSIPNFHLNYFYVVKSILELALLLQITIIIIIIVIWFGIVSCVYWSIAINHFVDVFIDDFCAIFSKSDQRFSNFQIVFTTLARLNSFQWIFTKFSYQFVFLFPFISIYFCDFSVFCCVVVIYETTFNVLYCWTIV